MKEGMRNGDAFFVEEKKVCPTVRLVISEQERGKTQDKTVDGLWKRNLGKEILCVVKMANIGMNLFKFKKMK